MPIANEASAQGGSNRKVTQKPNHVFAGLLTRQAGDNDILILVSSIQAASPVSVWSNTPKTARLRSPIQPCLTIQKHAELTIVQQFSPQMYCL